MVPVVVIVTDRLSKKTLSPAAGERAAGRRLKA